MNENQYKELCRLTDQVLLAPDATPACVSIPWLHIIREHPVFLENYESLFLPDRDIIDSIRIWLRSTRYKMLIMKTVLKSVFHSNSSVWSKMIKNLSSVDVLFISHLLNKSQIDDNEDFYYSDLPRKLNEDLYPSLIAMLNHTGKSTFQFSANQNSNGLCKVVFPRTLGLFYEIESIMLLWKESRRLRKSAKSEKNSLKKKFCPGHRLKLCPQPAWLQ